MTQSKPALANQKGLARKSGHTLLGCQLKTNRGKYCFLIELRYAKDV